ncbi:MAG: cytochrome c oxidase assembly protein [Bacillaceae bacterium]|nr:cytochrome c oxidase assembly protein [Bacillaceae bacterium]
MENIFNHYGFTELWNPKLIVFTFFFTIFYFKASGRFISTVEKWKKLSFLTGILIFYIAVGSPLHLIGHSYLFSVHMLEQALVYFVATPLILLGLPIKLIEEMFNYRFFNKMIGFFTNPIVAALMFNGLFSLYHFPIIFDYLSINHFYQNLYHSILTFTSIMMWLSIIYSPNKKHELSQLKKIGYILVNSVLITPVCALIIFSNNVLYTTYLNAPQLFEILPALEDQQLGGILMKMVQEGVFLTVIGIIFFKWVKQEREKDEMFSENEIASDKVV